MNKDLNWFEECLKNKTLIKKLQKIKIIITDVDGCLTDGQIFYSGNNKLTKGFSVQDGFAIVNAQKKGLLISVLTGRKDKCVEQRANDLKIPQNLFFQGFCNGKTEILKKIKKNNQLLKDEILLFGDDFLDIECLNQVGLFASPKNAIFYVQKKADFVVPKDGGHGAFRLLLDLILFLQKKHFAQKLIVESQTN